MTSQCTVRILILMVTIHSSTDAVTLTGSSEYAVPGNNFTLTCNVPDEANSVQLYRRPNVITYLGSIQVAGRQCYNTTANPVLCTPDVCSCTATSINYGTVFKWIIQPQTRDHGSVLFCRRTNPSLPDEADRVVESPDYTLQIQNAVTLTGSSEYAVSGNNFTLTCNVPDEANHVQLYRRPSVTTILGSVQVAGGQCYNTALTKPVLCTPDVCSCTATSSSYGTAFQWVIHPQTRDNGSLWFCRRTNPGLPDEADRVEDSPDYILQIQTAQTMSLSVTPSSAVVGQEVTLTCTASQGFTTSTSVFYRRNTFLVVEFAVNSTSCTSIPQGVRNYIFTCGSLPLRKVSLTIPAAYVTTEEHGSNWTCAIFFGAVSNTVHLTLNGTPHTDQRTTISSANTTPIDGPPSPPTHVFADCKGYGSAEVSWRAGTTGGYKQTFQVLYKTDGATKTYPETIAENGSEDYVMTLDNLKENTLHIFTVFALNSFGNATSTDTGKCTVHEKLSPMNNSTMFDAGVAMLCSGIIAMILTIATIIVFIKRKNTCLSDKDTEQPLPLQNVIDADSTADPQQDSRAYESLHGRSQPNTYEDLGSDDNGQRENSSDYINSSDGDYYNT